MWDSDRPQKMHCMAQFAATHMPVALEPDVPHLHFGPFTNHKGHTHRCRRNRSNFRANGRELMSVF